MSCWMRQCMIVGSRVRGRASEESAERRDLSRSSARVPLLRSFRFLLSAPFLSSLSFPLGAARRTMTGSTLVNAARRRRRPFPSRLLAAFVLLPLRLQRPTPPAHEFTSILFPSTSSSPLHPTLSLSFLPQNSRSARCLNLRPPLLASSRRLGARPINLSLESQNQWRVRRWRRAGKTVESRGGEGGQD